jgi:drug/metabolite transporter (DMT)-like permease
LSDHVLGALSGLVAALCWAIGSLLFERIGKVGASAGAMNLGKTAASGLVLLLVSLAVRGRFLPPGVTGRELIMLAASAVVGLTIGDTAYFASLRAIGAARGVLLLSTAPLFAVLIELPIRGVPPPRELAGVLLTLAGITLVIARPGPVAGPSPWRGVLFGLLAGLCQAVGSLLSRTATQGVVDPLSASWMRLLVGALVLAGLGALSGQLVTWVRELGQGRTFVRVAGASFIGTVLGLFLSQVALARASSAGVATTMLATSPVFALPIAHFTGGERATPRAVSGVLLAVAGIALLTWNA